MGNEELPSLEVFMRVSGLNRLINHAVSEENNRIEVSMMVSLSMRYVHMSYELLPRTVRSLIMTLSCGLFLYIYMYEVCQIG